MKGGARIAAGVGVGYVLGRTRKMRLALSLGGAVLARRSSGGPQELLQQGTSLIRSSPELTKITETVRAELLGAARAAAVTAASNRIDSLNARLQQRAAETGADEEPGESREFTSGRDEDEYDETSEDDYAGDDYERESDEEDLEDEYPDEEGEPEEDIDVEETDEDDGDQETRAPARARPAARTGRTRAGESRSRGPDKASGSEGRASATPGRRRVRADADTAEHAPVRRTRR
ncbi:hypothetical protein OH799_20390 [Nocardia sp. NBC_00881]|uniref:hypothetical protein n=1 Tax=Nocardia sp. NBC_00881 TaxID=2975995 RepID=UPI0038639C8B|nr:hypothetical protein OH799_20390 [Nocardia sp. NBC_00881]